MPEFHAPTTEALRLDELRDVLRDAYGIDGELRRLPGENLNVAVTTPDGRRWVAKVAGDQQPAEFVALEQAALAHAARAGADLRLPQISENKFGNLETVFRVSDSSPKRLRLLEFIPGKPWSDLSDISNDLRLDLGRKLALFDRAMAGFNHPLAPRPHRWNLVCLAQHRPVIATIADPEKRGLLAWAIDQFVNNISPIVNRLSVQFIHGDANPENLMVEGDELTGLVDFGDCCWNPPVCELAICLAYQMMDEDDPWAAARPVVEGFESVIPLSGEERSILPGLIAGRLANTLCVATGRRALDPGHPNWFVSERPAWVLLNTLRATGDLPV